MNWVVILKMVPDTVEELMVAEDGRSLDTQWLRMIVSEPDEHALEEAILLKERCGGTVTAITLEAPEVDEILYTALARGADRAVKISGEWTGLRSTATAQIFSTYIKDWLGQNLSETLVLTGSQAIDDLEGEMAPYLAHHLGTPYVGVVSGVRLEEGKVIIMKEFAGGLRGEFELSLPAVLGIQSAEKPPRYVPVAKVRSIMKSVKIDTVESSLPEIPASLSVEKMYKPEIAGRAEMLAGTPEEIAKRIVEILAERGLI